MISDTLATRVSVDLTGGFKSTLLLYLVAEHMHNAGMPGKIRPHVTQRINSGAREAGKDRPNPVPIVNRAIEWCKQEFKVEFDHMHVMPVDFWFVHIISGRQTLELAEKAMLRHLYDCLKDTLYDDWWEEGNPSIPNIPAIRHYNACTNVEHEDYYECKKSYPVKSKINNKEYSFFDGDVKSFLPFYSMTKSEVMQIAKDKGILEQVIENSYSCEQNTTIELPPCGECTVCEIQNANT